MEKISLTSLIVWLISIRVTPMFFTFPEFDAPAGKSSWIALLLATLPAVLGLWVAVRLWRLDRTAPSPTRSTPGGTHRLVAVNSTFAAFLSLQAGLSLWELDEILVTTMFFRTPSAAVSAR